MDPKYGDKSLFWRSRIVLPAMYFGLCGRYLEANNFNYRMMRFYKVAGCTLTQLKERDNLCQYEKVDYLERHSYRLHFQNQFAGNLSNKVDGYGKGSRNDCGEDRRHFFPSCGLTKLIIASIFECSCSLFRPFFVNSLLFFENKLYSVIRY